MIPPVMTAEQEEAESAQLSDRLRRMSEEYLRRHPEITPGVKGSTQQAIDELLGRIAAKAKVSKTVS